MKSYEQSVLIVKVGTTTVTTATASGHRATDVASFENIFGQLWALRDQGLQTVLVASGALAVANASKHASAFEAADRQTRISWGWMELTNIWRAQVVSQYDSAIEGHLLIYCCNTNFEQSYMERIHDGLARRDSLLICNEANLAGGNDHLAAKIGCSLAGRLGAENIRGAVMLSDVEGLYADVADSGSLIRVADTQHIQALEGDAVHYSGSSFGTGAMHTKLEAAQQLASAGVTTYIAHGRQSNAIERALAGEIGTRFDLQATKTIVE